MSTNAVVLEPDGTAHEPLVLGAKIQREVFPEIERSAPTLKQLTKQIK